MIPRFTSRLASTALVAVFVLVLAGLAVAHRALTEADRARATLDAEVSAGFVGNFLQVHAEALSSFHGYYFDDPAEATRHQARFAMLVGAMQEHANSFSRVFITDSTGRVTRDTVLRGKGRTLPPGLVLDTLERYDVDSLARQARLTGRTVVGPTSAAVPGRRRGTEPDSGILILEPLDVEGRFVGFAGGEITTGALLAGLAPHHGSDRLQLALTGDSTRTHVRRVFHTGSGIRVSSVQEASAPVPLPGGGTWRIEVEHAASGVTRTVLWTLGIVTLTGLALGVAHERRQARRIAERSAELERLSSELLSANRAKSEFLANVSHELRTPLNAIVGFADLLRDGVYGELAPRQVSPVQRIEASADHLRHLVDQVLDLAKIAAGRLEVHTEILDLRPFVLDVASEVESLISEKQLALSLAVGASLPRVRTDPTHLRQILVNLIGNAIKHTQTGGITVRGRFIEPNGDGNGAARHVAGRFTTPRPPLAPGAPGGGNRPPNPSRLWVALQVVDTGSGIAATDHERIFDEFEQVNAGPRGDSMARGTGLGLSISRRLARLLGGDITLESEVGKGSTFTLWLPVDPADVKPRTGSMRRVPTTETKVVG
jgi:signal transduction histidine kinase